MHLSFNKIILILLTISASNSHAIDVNAPEKALLATHISLLAGLCLSLPLISAKFNQAAEKTTEPHDPESETALQNKSNIDMSYIGIPAGLLLSVGSLFLNHLNKNAHSMSDTIKPTIVGLCSGALLSRAMNNDLKSVISATEATALILGYTLVNAYCEEKRSLATRIVAGMAVLTAGVEYSSDKGTQVKFFGIPVWKSAPAA